MEPLPGGSGSVLAARLPAAAAADFLEWNTTATPTGLFNRVLSRERSIEKISATNPRVPALEDDQPIKTYTTSRSSSHYYRSSGPTPSPAPRAMKAPAYSRRLGRTASSSPPG